MRRLLRPMPRHGCIDQEGIEWDNRWLVRSGPTLNILWLQYDAAIATPQFASGEALVAIFIGASDSSAGGGGDEAGDRLQWKFAPDRNAHRNSKRGTDEKGEYGAC
jgi:hypothetical protein